MNRRQLCLRLLPGFALSQDFAFSQLNEAAPYSADDYSIWSLLIPAIQSDPGREYLIAARPAAPDGIPFLRTGKATTAIEKAREASLQAKNVSYESSVPDGLTAAFLEALSRASRPTLLLTPIDRRLEIQMSYRLLSQTQVKAFLNLSRPVVPAHWKQDASVARQFRGCNQISSFSVPCYDSKRELALVWSRTGPSCWNSAWSLFMRSGDAWSRKQWDSERHDLCN